MRRRGVVVRVLARAHRFAVAALHAPVDLLLDRGGGLEVAHVGGGVLVQQDAGVEQAVGVEQPLRLLHDAVELVAVLPADEGRHDAPGAVLGLQGAAFGEHEVDQVLREALVAAGGVEVLIEHEVDVAVLGVAEDDAVAVGVLVEEVGERGARRQ